MATPIQVLVPDIGGFKDVDVIDVLVKDGNRLDKFRQLFGDERQDYNQARPHSSLGDQAPEAFAGAWSRTASSDPKLASGLKGSQQSSLLEVLS